MADKFNKNLMKIVNDGPGKSTIIFHDRNGRRKKNGAFLTQMLDAELKKEATIIASIKENFINAMADVYSESTEKTAIGDFSKKLKDAVGNSFTEFRVNIVKEQIKLKDEYNEMFPVADMDMESMQKMGNRVRAASKEELEKKVSNFQTTGGLVSDIRTSREELDLTGAICRSRNMDEAADKLRASDAIWNTSEPWKITPEYDELAETEHHLKMIKNMADNGEFYTSIDGDKNRSAEMKDIFQPRNIREKGRKDAAV